MNYNPQNPLIVQSDKTVLLEVDNPRYDECRDRLAVFAELEKSPEYIHTYRVSPLSLWNASAAGASYESVAGSLLEYSKYDVPQSVLDDIRDYMGRYGRLKLRKDDGRLLLYSDDAYIITEIAHDKRAKPYVSGQVDQFTLEIPSHFRGSIKQTLIKIGFPVEDLAGYTTGDVMNFALRDRSLSGSEFGLRPYQADACDSYWAGGGPSGGSGVLVLPCGAGKTVIGLGAMARAQTNTLILVTGTTAAHQWRSEIIDKTNIPEDSIGEYSGESKEIRPVTIATYQVMTYRTRGKRSSGEPSPSEFPHLGVFESHNWGLIIYDEVHLLPAPVFRITADIQAKRRLGLTATLVREDGRADDVFSLIGPKKYDVPWRVLEKQGWIAEAICTEIRVPLIETSRLEYATAEFQEKFRIASENPNKLDVIEHLIDRHKGDNVLIIGQYLDQLDKIAERFGAPIITGKTPNIERDKLYSSFRKGENKLLVVSKVANFAIDLPDANVAIQVSGTFGSRQEEAQRLGRVLRPKSNGSQARFYTVVTKDTRDQEFAANRQLFLTEQGYRYEIVNAADLAAGLQTADRRPQP